MDFRLYFLDGANRIKHAAEFACDDDAQAIEAVEQHRDGHDMELWQGKRFVKKVPKLS